MRVVMNGVCPSSAPVSAALSVRYSHRSVVIVGGLICSVAVALGSFSRNLVELYLTVGFFNGKCLNFLSRTVSCMQFETHRVSLLQVLATQ